MTTISKLIDSKVDANEQLHKEKLKKGLNKLLQVEDWQAPTFVNSWANVSGYEAGYYKDPWGRVYLKGVLGTGTSGTVAFTLPVGYRPSESLLFPALQTSATAGAYVDVNTDGTVNLVRTGTTIFINNVSFRV